MALYNSFLETRHIRVFLSSTFIDMQDERDALMKKTFPLLREKAAKRNVSLTEVDLRWGVTPEERMDGKVVEICLREVENSIPFFIGIIGDRYGWTPSKKDVGPVVRERFPQVDSYLERHLSLIEMEMQFGVLERPEDMHAFFFIKERLPWEQYPEYGEDSEKSKKLALLKKTVKENGRYPVSSYTSPEDLSLQVEEAFTNLLDSLFPESSSSEEERERVSQAAYLNSLCHCFIRRQEYFDELNDWLKDSGDNKPMAVTGFFGSGKSALLANWIIDISGQEHPNTKVVYHFIGRGGCPGTSDHVISSICNQIRNAFGFESREQLYGADRSSSKELSDLYARIDTESSENVLIVLDAINRLMDVDDPKRMDWLPLPPNRVKIVVSIYGDDETDANLHKLGFRTLQVQPLTKEERECIINRYLALFSKKLQKEQVERIASNELCGNAMVLKTLLDELVNYGRFDSLNNKIGAYLRKDSKEGFFKVVTDGYIRDFGDLARYAMSLLVVSRYGLYEDEIISITGAKQVEWSRLFSALQPHLRVENGLISFSNRLMSEAIKDNYLDEFFLGKTARERLVDFLDDYEIDQDYHRSMSEQCRREIVSCIGQNKTTHAIDEVPYQLYALGWNSKLYSFLLDIDVFMYLYNTSRLDLRTYWLNLHHELIDYLPLVEALPNEDKGAVLYALADFATYDKVEPSAALKYCEMALVYAKDDLEKARILSTAGSACLTAGNNVYKAVEYFEETLVVLKKVLGDVDPSGTYMDLSRAYRFLGENNKAVEMAEMAVTFRESAYGKNNPRTAHSYCSLADAYLGVKRLWPAKDYADLALEVFREFEFPHGEDLNVAIALETKASVCDALCDDSSALECLSEANRIRSSYYGGNHPSISVNVRTIGLHYARLAYMAMEEAAEEFQNSLGDNHPDTVKTLQYLKLLSWADV